MSNVFRILRTTFIKISLFFIEWWGAGVVFCLERV